MVSDELVLGFDTSAAHCAAALLYNGQIVASGATEMLKGQSEALGPLIKDLLVSQNFPINRVTRIGVGIGPGNYTGTRVSVSFARGLSLALGRPAFGISSFEATYFGHNEPAHVIVPATGERIYVQSYPKTSDVIWIGSEKEMDFSSAKRLDRCSGQRLSENIAHIASQRSFIDVSPPIPLYVKPADAAPTREQPPKILQ